MEIVRAPLSCAVHDDSEIGTARRRAQVLATDIGFNESDGARVALATTELATNLVRHGRGGVLYVRSFSVDAAPTVEILSVDSGPGMVNVEACMRDGFSRGGTSGSGLGAVKRLAAEFDIYSEVGKGCVTLARLRPANAPAQPVAVRWRWGAVSTPAPGETVIGDGWRVRFDDQRVGLLVVDGLGHGPLAADASDVATDLFEQVPIGQTQLYFTRAHQIMRTTRGAAMAVATASAASTTLQYTGVGNISGFLLPREGKMRGLVSHNGTVGAEMRKVQELNYEWTMHDRLVMHSDGLLSRWDLSSYSGLLDRHPSVIAAVLHRDFLRGRDDATVIVMERVT